MKRVLIYMTLALMMIGAAVAASAAVKRVSIGFILERVRDCWNDACTASIAFAKVPGLSSVANRRRPAGTGARCRS